MCFLNKINFSSDCMGDSKWLLTWCAKSMVIKRHAFKCFCVKIRSASCTFAAPSRLCEVQCLTKQLTTFVFTLPLLFGCSERCPEVANFSIRSIAEFAWTSNFLTDFANDRVSHSTSSRFSPSSWSTVTVAMPNAPSLSSRLVWSMQSQSNVFCRFSRHQPKRCCAHSAPYNAFAVSVFGPGTEECVQKKQGLAIVWKNHPCTLQFFH